MTSNTFEGFGLPATLAACLARMEYTTPTPIQMQSIPPALKGRDILGSAQTGTGKTGAFCIPMIAALLNDPTMTALVMTPTRELAVQVLDVARLMIERGSNIRTALLIGGEPMGKQFRQLDQRPRLIVGTPGRINDHLRRNPDLFDATRFVVLDEADRMLDMGFSVQIDTILDAVQPERQTLMFSATFAPKILTFARTYLDNPERVEIESAKVSAENISHEMIQTSQDGKYGVLRGELESREGSVIIFVKTKRGADKLAGRLKDDGVAAEPLHGGLNQRQRDRATRAFRKMDFRILVATDVAARGLDIPHVEHVINFDMPMVAEDYIHRIGRTARAGAKGSALALVSPQDRGLWLDVERAMNPGKARASGDREERGGERRPFRKGPPKKGGFKRREDGGRSSYGDRPSYGERKSYGVRPAHGERKSYGDRPRSENGERQSFGERKSYNDRPRGENGDRPRSENGDRPSYGGERKSYGDRARSGNGEARTGGKKFGDANGNKFGGNKSEGRYERSDKPRSDKPRSGDKPQARRGAGRFNSNGGGNGGNGNKGGQGFKRRSAA